MPIVALETLDSHELMPDHVDPTRFTVVGASDFVLGNVTQLLVDPDRGEVVYFVVNTRLSSYRDGRGEERLLPVAWTTLLPMRRQVRVPRISRYSFRMLPLFDPQAIP
ncbi:MAG TPA: hypothetical protein V6D47_17420, partial [Oscillatoriaceae cyanobacterium]